jgi:hypothetical protein
LSEIILNKIQIKRGLKANLPVLDPGEPALCTDTGEIAYGTSTGNIFVNFAADKMSELLRLSVSQAGKLAIDGVEQVGGGGSVPSNVILFEEWAGGESVTIDTSVTPPADTSAPVLTITAGGIFTGNKSVTMSVNETATIYYTLDGSTPTTSSTVYSSPLSISATTTLKAFARDTAGNSSAVQTVTYTLDATPPADTTAPNNVTNLQYSNLAQTTLTLSWTASASSDVASYDVFNGSTLLANVAGTTYNVTGLSASTQYTFTVKAKDAANNIASGTSVTVTTSAPADTIAPVLTITPSATFADTQTVTMSTNETATIWYTLDDSDPKTSGTKLQYTAPLTLTETDTIKAYAVDSANNASAVQTVTYIKEVVSTVVASDNFNRADGAIGTSVTGQVWNGGTIISNQVGFSTASTSYPNLDVGKSDNISIEMDLILPTIASGTISGIAVRVNSSSNQALIYGATTTATKIGLVNTLSGATAVPAATNFTFVAGQPYRLKVEVTGNIYKCYLDGVLTHTYTDTTSTGIGNTKHGFCFYNTTVPRGDNFVINNL